MKKSLIYTGATSLALLAGVATTILLNNASAETADSSSSAPVAALTNSTSLGAALQPSRNETVYVMTDYTGAPNKTFIGNTLDTDESNLPIKLAVTYYLDGSEISAAELAGKSGHVKIVFKYTATATYQGKLVPFLGLTGMSLDKTKFKNIEVVNGKILSENDQIMVAGYALAGANEDLGTDFLPDSFTLEANVTNFELGNTYTFATNEIFAEFDTSKLSTVDELINSMNQLGAGIEQILTGATSLNDGIDAFATGIAELQSGAAGLNNGANQLAAGANELSSGTTELASGTSELYAGATALADGTATISNYLNEITSQNATINYGVNAVIANTLAQVNAAIADYGYSVDINTYKTILPAIINSLPEGATKASLAAAKDSLDLHVGILSYTGGVAQVAAGAAELNGKMTDFTEGAANLNAGATVIANGATELASGTEELLAGTVQLKAGVDLLAAGADQLVAGSQALKDGIATFKTTGIDRLVDLANHDLANFTANLRATVNAAKSYRHYKSTSAQNVKFIFKTPSIK